jgi:hypothetical protein
MRARSTSSGVPRSVGGGSGDVEGRCSPLSNLDRIQLEIELARRGLRW